MDPCNIHEIKDVLSRHGFHFSKAKGQNFLTQSWVPERIAREAGVDRDCGVLEVGPGVGPLTQWLCRLAGQVTAVELDKRLQPVLAETLGQPENLNLIFGDILKQDIPTLVAEQFPGLRVKACANLPYYITSDILAALLEAKAKAEATLGKEGRILVRASGTEALIRVMVEAPEEAVAKDVATQMANTVENLQK